MVRIFQDDVKKVKMHLVSDISDACHSIDNIDQLPRRVSNDYLTSWHSN